jgi:predicted nucleic acid-binding Zn ribbon protein
MPNMPNIPDTSSLFNKKNVEQILNDIQSLQIEDHWEKIMGVTIAKFTDRVEIRNGTLFIYTAVAPLKNELMFQKELIVQRVNESIGENLVREVVVS